MADRDGESDKIPRALAQRQGLAARVAPAPRSFTVTVDLGVDELWQHILAHRDVRVADEPAPEPAPPAGEPFLLARKGPDAIVLRHWAGSADAVSPLVVLRLARDGPHLRVQGRFEQPRSAPVFTTLAIPPTPWWQIAAPLVVVGVGLGLIYGFTGSAGIWALLVALVLFAVPSGVVMLPGLALWDAESRRMQRAALWRLLGEVLTPIALPEAGRDDPFR